MHTHERTASPSINFLSNESIQKSLLPNGLTVISENVKTVRSVSVGLWIATGSRDETKENAGMAHFIEHMVFKGTKKRDYIEISKSLERVGGYLNAFTSKENTCFYARVLDEHTNIAVDVLTDLVFNPTLPQHELEKEKGVIIEEIKSADDTPDDVIFEDFDKYTYDKHPFALPIAGSEKTVRSFTRKKVRSHLEKNYTTDKMILSAAGNIHHAELVKLAEKYIPKKQSQREHKREPYDTRFYKPFEKVIHKPISQAHVVLGFPFHRHDDDYYTMLLLNMILGGGMSSRLNLELREKHGLAYSVFSSFNSGDEVNLFTTYIGTEANKVKKALSLIRVELAKVAEKLVPQKELDLNKAQLKGALIMSQESMSSRMTHLARDLYYFGRTRTDSEVLEKVNAVSPKTLRALAERLFDEKRYSTLTYLPKKK